MFALASLVAVSSETEEKVAAYWVAQEAKEAAWNEYSSLMDEHNRRRAAEAPARIRRSRELMRAEARFDSLEHSASWAAGDVEQSLRVANPGAEQRSIMATKRALLTPR